jgi:hypothetical protein
MRGYAIPLEGASDMEIIGGMWWKMTPQQFPMEAVVETKLTEACGRPYWFAKTRIHPRDKGNAWRGFTDAPGASEAHRQDAMRRCYQLTINMAQGKMTPLEFRRAQEEWWKNWPSGE